MRDETERAFANIDSDLMTGKNILLLQTGCSSYILGARIRNEAREVREWILSQEKAEHVCHEYIKTHTIPETESDDTAATKVVTERLILTYS